MNRRDFLKTAAALGAGAVITSGLPGRSWAAREGPAVVMAKGQSPAKLARAAVGGLGGIAAFVKRGETVVVKPNIGWDRTPEQAADTHPEIVSEVVRMCLEAGAAKVKVFDRTCNDARRCYVNSGIAPALAAINDPRVELTHIDERKFKEVDIPGGRLLPRWPVYEEVLDADKFINVPIAKHHSAAVLTMGMKNVMGIIGGNRAVLHKDINDALPDLNRIVKSHLTIVDLTRVLIANGPQGGRLEDVRRLDTVVAGRDIVAVDTVAASLFGKGPGEVRYLRIAGDSGLGVADMGRIRITRVNV